MTSVVKREENTRPIFKWRIHLIFILSQMALVSFPHLSSIVTSHSVLHQILSNLPNVAWSIKQLPYSVVSLHPVCNPESYSLNPKFRFDFEILLTSASEILQYQKDDIPYHSNKALLTWLASFSSHHPPAIIPAHTTLTAWPVFP